MRLSGRWVATDARPVHSRSGRRGSPAVHGRDWCRRKATHPVAALVVTVITAASALKRMSRTSKTRPGISSWIPLVDRADEGGDDDGEGRGGRYGPPVTMPLGERLVDEEAHHPVLDEVRAFRRHRHPDEDEQVDGRGPEPDPELRPARPRAHPLREHRRHDQDHAQAEERAQIPSPMTPASERAIPRVE